MLTLLAKLGLDTSAFQRGLAASTDLSKRAGNKMGIEVGKDFAKALKRTIGAGALVGAAISAGREAQEIKDMADALGISAQQAAAMEIVTKRLGDTSNVSADEVKRLAGEIVNAGGVASEEALQRIASAAGVVEDAFKGVKNILLEVASGIALVIERFIRLGRVGMLPITALTAQIMTLAKGGSLNQSGKVANEMVSETWNDLFAPSRLGNDSAPSIAARAQRTKKEPTWEDFYDETAKKQAEEKWDETMEWKKRRDDAAKRGFRSASKTGSMTGDVDTLAHLGLGLGRTSINYGKQLVDETKTQTRLLREQVSILRRKL